MHDFVNEIHGIYIFLSLKTFSHDTTHKRVSFFHFKQYNMEGFGLIFINIFVPIT